MKRRCFLRTSAGLAAGLLAEGVWAVERTRATARQFAFQELRPERSEVPVTRVTPADGHYVFTYYDVCPFSPSGRYLAATRLPFQDRLPVLGDTADVCVIDLHRQTIRSVYTTKSWGFQTGANAQWGVTDRFLYTNDVIGGQAVCVRIDLETDRVQAFAGPMYSMAPDESCVIGFPLELLDVTQPGYGVPPRELGKPRQLPVGAAQDEGIWRTDLRTNERRLLVCLAQVTAKLPEPPPQPNGTFYFWHSKFNRQGTRIMQVLRCLFPTGWGRRNVSVFTMSADGSEIHYTPSKPVWGHRGGHPNWHPDGEHLIRNLKPDGKTERFCKVRYDGSRIEVLTEKFTGGGHPTIEPAGRFVLTDAYPREDKRKVTILLYDLASEQKHELCQLTTIDRQTLRHAEHRLDGHPVWSRDYRRVCFQAATDNCRQLFVADLAGIV